MSFGWLRRPPDQPNVGAGSASSARTLRGTGFEKPERLTRPGRTGLNRPSDVVGRTTPGER